MKKTFGFILTTILANVAFAQTVRPVSLSSLDLFSPNGKIEEQKLINTSYTLETGTINGVAYKFWHSEGSGYFSGVRNYEGNFSNITNRGDYQTDYTIARKEHWEVLCKKDSISDSKSCHLKKGGLWVYAYGKGKNQISIGHDHYPRSTVAIRINDGQVFTVPSNNDGDFSVSASAKIIQQLKSANSVTTRYMEWPYQTWKDNSFDLYGFNEAFQYINWAVSQIK